MSEWHETTLAELSTDVAYGYTESATEQKVGPRFLRITDIQNGVVDWNTVPYCPISDSDLAKYRLEFGDIVIARTGNSTGENYIFNSDEDSVFASYLIRFKIDPDKADPYFVWYSMRAPSWWRFISSSKTGSAQAGANAKVLGRFPIRIPPLPEQRAIASILGALDDKIDLNRRMNETLESMARAIFKSWFVDFDPVRAKMEGKQPCGMDAETAALFPDRLVESELGLIPEGWKVATLGDGIEILDNKRVPLNKRQRAERQGKFPYYGAAAIMDYVDDYLFDGVYILAGEDGSVIDESGYPVVQYVWGKFWVNNHAHVLKGKNGISDEHLLLQLKSTNINAYVTGAVQLKLNQGNLKAIPLILPDLAVCAAFAQLVRPMFAVFRSNSDESRTLAELRDLLLPKLLRGEIRVKEAEQMVEAAV